MDEDFILGLVVFLGLALCGISVLWVAWRRQQSRESDNIYYDTV